MSLIYRGQTAQPSATINTVESGMQGTFLGRSFPIRTTQKTSQSVAAKLQFRGATY